MHNIKLTFILILVSVSLCAQQNEIEKAINMLNDRGEVYIKFSLHNSELPILHELSKEMSLDKVAGNEVYAYANLREFTKFMSHDIEFELLTPPSMLYPSILENSEKTREIDSWDYYPNWDEYNDKMDQFVVAYPDLCELVTIGTSANGKEIMAIHINNNLGEDQNEPEFLYTSSIHGDELVGYVMTLRLIDYLLSNYGILGNVTQMVDNIDIWINPLANPDGTFAGGDNSVWGATRGNANGIDINRNFIDPEDGPHPDGNPWQTETILFMDFAEDHNFTMSSNMHGGAEVINYPWDTWPRLAADDDWWQYVSREYVDLVHENSWAGYFTDLNNGITNGYAWYSISGGRQDYMNYFHNCREMTLEISSIKLPPEGQLNDFWEANYRSLLAYLEQVMNGFSGNITNAVTGSPIVAKIEIDGHDLDNSEVYSHQPLGYYHRLIKEGNYDVTFSAFGYYDKVVNVNIIDDQLLDLDVELMPVGTLISDFSSSATIAGPGSLVNYYDHSLGNDIVSWEWTFEGGNPATSNEPSPENINYENIGEYDVTLVITNGSGETDTKFIEDYMVIKEAVAIENTSVTICDAVFYDTGLENDNYSDNEELTITFYPEVQNMQVILDFIEFDLENHFYCENDYLEIFDGEDIAAPQLGLWCGTNNPGRVYATNETGALTVLFHSNSSITKPGWKAVISCDSNVGLNNNEVVEVSIYPNPAKGVVNISSENYISEVSLCDLSGRLLHETVSPSKIKSLDVSDYNPGLYLIKFKTDGKWIIRKIILTGR